MNRVFRVAFTAHLTAALLSMPRPAFAEHPKAYDTESRDDACTIDSDCADMPHVNSACAHYCGDKDHCNSKTMLCGAVNKESRMREVSCFVNAPCRKPAQVRCFGGKCQSQE